MQLATVVVLTARQTKGSTPLHDTLILK